MNGVAGDFSLVTPVEGHGAGTRVHVGVSPRHPAQLVLDFSDRAQALTDARVLLCGHVGALKLRQSGYTGRLAVRPPLAAGRTPDIFPAG